MKEIILDTETTGLSVKEGHRIVEIGCIELENFIPTNNNFHCYLNPERKVSKKALETHGYTDEFLSDKKKFLEIADDFLSYINSFNITSVICTDVMRDGMKKGINFDMINNILENTSIPCVVSGGVSNLDDLIKLKAKDNNQIYGVIIGKALYDKSIKLNDALSVTK